MTIAIASIQRNRRPWIVEWLAFHMMVGFDRFYVYCHECDDGTEVVVDKLSRRYPVMLLNMRNGTWEMPQLSAYKHAVGTFLGDVDWMAFIDGDEFLFPTKQASMAEALAPYENQDLSALAAFWMCYGSSGRIEEPSGLIMENFPRHSHPSFIPNHHYKSIVRGRQSEIYPTNSHLFITPRGTYDEQMRLMVNRVATELVPSYDVFRINHYVTQSYEYFSRTKQHMPLADLSREHRRPSAWFDAHDRNECDDGVSYNFLVRLKLKVRELESYLAEA